ncbi:hypothetical protein ABEB36_014646 [Hypothenemus hampei]|uniref:Uncharacterized protein n=1 Tax=Hypothenemus hampei TaxID=57062 RepID=A0ABD1E3A1_HYPHA
MVILAQDDCRTTSVVAPIGVVLPVWGVQSGVVRVWRVRTTGFRGQATTRKMPYFVTILTDWSAVPTTCVGNVSIVSSSSGPGGVLGVSTVISGGSLIPGVRKTFRGVAVPKVPSRKLRPILVWPGDRLWRH